MFTNNLEMLENTDIKISKKKEKGITFEELYNLWIKSKEDVKPGTKSNYETNFKRSKKLYGLEIAKINGIMLQNIFYSLDLTNSTLRLLRSFWSNIWDFAILNDMATKNYAKFLKLPVQEKGNKTGDRERPISKEELQVLWDNLYNYDVDKYRIIDMVLILCYTGLRIGELLNIKVKDIDLKEKSIKIINSKTVNGIRTIPIHDKLLPLITNRMYKGNEYLFTTSDNKHYKYDSFDNHFRILCKDLKLKYHTLHDTRHTFATLLVNAEVNKEVIIKMIGHKRYKTTLDIYVHKNYDDMKKAINQI